MPGKCTVRGLFDRCVFETRDGRDKNGPRGKNEFVRGSRRNVVFGPGRSLLQLCADGRERPGGRGARLVGVFD